MILIVDDEPGRMEVYIEALKLSNYQVELVENIDNALKYFDKKQEEVELLILDIMMPSGTLNTEKGISGGLKTGIVFYKKIREKNENLPIIIFSNISEIDDQQIEQDIHPDTKIKSKFLNKLRTLTGQLVEEVREILEK